MQKLQGGLQLIRIAENKKKPLLNTISWSPFHREEKIDFPREFSVFPSALYPENRIEL